MPALPFPSATWPAAAGILAAYVFVLGIELGSSVQAADGDPPSSSRIWHLKCTAARTDERTAEALFEGTFLGDPFQYTVEVTTTAERDRTVVAGTAQLDGDKYEWSGYVRGKVFYGQYRSLKGNNGDSRLEEAK